MFPNIAAAAGLARQQQSKDQCLRESRREQRVAPGLVIAAGFSAGEQRLVEFGSHIRYQLFEPSDALRGDDLTHQSRSVSEHLRDSLRFFRRGCSRPRMANRIRSKLP